MNEPCESLKFILQIKGKKYYLMLHYYSSPDGKKEMTNKMA